MVSSVFRSSSRPTFYFYPFRWASQKCTSHDLRSGSMVQCESSTAFCLPASRLRSNMLWKVGRKICHWKKFEGQTIQQNLLQNYIAVPPTFFLHFGSEDVVSVVKKTLKMNWLSTRSAIHAETGECATGELKLEWSVVGNFVYIWHTYNNVELGLYGLEMKITVLSKPCIYTLVARK